VAIEVKCEGYVRREELAIEKAAKAELITIPDDFDYLAIQALSREAREKFSQRRPRTLGMAGRMPGITPSDVAIVALFLHRREREMVLSSG
jgi:tRNA uridine 5-carboxymethylaminomethyl modification enzyme